MDSVPGAAQLVGERNDARGQPLRVVEEHYLNHIYPPCPEVRIADGSLESKGCNTDRVDRAVALELQPIGPVAEI
jgi:hypothetical protein